MNLEAHNAALARYLDDWLAQQHQKNKLDAEGVSASAEFRFTDWKVELEVRITNGANGYVATAASDPNALKRTRKNKRHGKAADICIGLVNEAFGEMEGKL